MAKTVRTTISLPEDVIEMGKERAKMFRLPFSRHVAQLLLEDYRSGQRMITIVAEEPASYRRMREKNEKPEKS